MDLTEAMIAAAGTDDYWETWSRDVMDRWPRVFVAAVMPGQTCTWLFEPNTPAAERYGGAWHTAAHHLQRVDTAVSLDLTTDVDSVRKTMPLETVLQGVSWLVWDLTGEFLTD